MNTRVYSSSMVDSKVIVLPGDAVPLAVGNDIKLGPGTYCGGGREEGSSVFVKPGILRRKDRDGSSSFWVNTQHKRYVPSEGEKVIGVILRTGRVYRVDIGASQSASLPELAFEGATKRNKPIVQVGDLVFGSLCQADPDFEPEMTCVDSSGRSNGMGLLKKPGCIISCTLSLCRRLLSKQCAVMEELQKHYKFECVVGLNGRVWLSAPILMHTIIIRNCIKSSEFMSEDSIKEMVRQAVLT